MSSLLSRCPTETHMSSNSKAARQQRPAVQETPARLDDRRRAGELILHIRDGKLKSYRNGHGLASRHEWTSDASLFGAMLAAHAAIARYLFMRTELDRGAAAPPSGAQGTAAAEEVRAIVSYAVQMLRGRGAGPEYVLIRLREVLATLVGNDSRTTQRVRRQVMRWAVEEFYGPLHARSTPESSETHVQPSFSTAEAVADDRGTKQGVENRSEAKLRFDARRGVPVEG